MKFCCFGSQQSQRPHNNSSTGQTSGIPTGNNVRLFTHNALRSATDNFHPKNKVGVGGFGVVYNGVLKDDSQVAIKCLSAKSRQGTREFLTELNVISNIRRPNLVMLIGCCIEGDNRILVYEYLENNSLATALLGGTETYINTWSTLFLSIRDNEFISGSTSKRIAMDWKTRVAICIGTAQGLHYLHEEADPPIVHRDIKASNVLLDRKLSPKIGDFGHAKLFPDNVTHISTRVAGTMGYLAPEYALLGQLTKKADIYSDGVLVLEVISGRSSTKTSWGEDMSVLLDWTWKQLDTGRLLEIVDPELVEYPEDEVLRFIKVALFCTQGASQKRPSMNQVLEMLVSKMALDDTSLTPPGLVKNIHSRGKDSGESSQSYIKRRGGNYDSSNPYVTSTGMQSSSFTLTQMQPR